MATWAFDESVELGPLAAGSANDDGAVQWTEFLQIVRSRHALACAGELQGILSRIEKQPSERSALELKVTRGRILGRLDVTRYLSMRSAVGFQRRFPVVATVSTPATPENVAVSVALEEVLGQLARMPLPRPSAESKAADEAYSSLHRHRQRWPWEIVPKAGTLDQLRLTLEHRLARRQTGNSDGYTAFQDWLDEWMVRPDRIGGSSLRTLAEGLLALPVESFFWDRVFEVWCLDEVHRALLSNGCASVEGPRQLNRRDVGPIWRLKHRNEEIRLWFQRSIPLGSGRWKFEGGKALRGIPDIVVQRSKATPLIVDAKLRNISAGSASSEIYKMLGYCENFNLGVAGGFQGLLIFPERARSLSSLVGPNGGRLSLASVVPSQAHETGVTPGVQEAIGAWLD